MFARTRAFVISITMLLVLAALPVSTAIAGTDNFHAHLNGAGNVPATDTQAQGQALFRFNEDASSLYFKINAANVENVFASHIHCAPAGVNGPAGVTLLLLGEPLTNPEGVIVEGTVSAPDPGNQCGWTSLADVENAIRSGNAYVNLHTTAHHSGEIRGQIR